jgi:hypothetical protein
METDREMSGGRRGPRRLRNAATGLARAGFVKRARNRRIERGIGIGGVAELDPAASVINAFANGSGELRH